MEELGSINAVLKMAARDLEKARARDKLMAEKKMGRDDRSGKFVSGSAARKGNSVTVVTEKVSRGKIGSYTLRTVDSGRFTAAKRAAGASLKRSLKDK